MDQSHLVLQQALSLSGLIGAAAAYAGIIRRRQERRIALNTTAASQSAIDRVERSLVLGRIDHTFVRTAYLPHRRYSLLNRRRPR
jgi:hypothetical protein